MKNIARGGVDRHGPRVAGGIRPLLADVELKGFKFVIRHDMPLSVSGLIIIVSASDF